MNRMDDELGDINIDLAPRPKVTEPGNDLELTALLPTPASYLDNEVDPIGQICTSTSLSDNEVEPIGQILKNEVEPIGQILNNEVDPIGQILNNKVDPIGQILNNEVDPIGQILNNVDPIGQILNNEVVPKGQILNNEVDSIGQILNNEVDPIGQISTSTCLSDNEVDPIAQISTSTTLSHNEVDLTGQNPTHASHLDNDLDPIGQIPIPVSHSNDHDPISRIPIQWLRLQRLMVDKGWYINYELYEPVRRTIQARDSKPCTTVTTTYRNIPPYSNCQVIINILSIIFYLVDIATDAMVAFSFFSNDQMTYFWLTLTFMILPAIVTNVWSFILHLMIDTKGSTYRTRVVPIPRLFGLRTAMVTVCHVVCTLLQLSPLLRYASSIYYGLKSRQHTFLNHTHADHTHADHTHSHHTHSDHTSHHTYLMRYALYDKCRAEEIRSKKLRLFEAALEAGPQLILQIYILMVLTHTQRPELTQLLLSGASIMTSWIGISWTHVAYLRAVRCLQGCQLSIPATIVYFLWRLLDIGPRVLTFSLFAVAFTYYVTVVIAVHWGGMFVWYILKRPLNLEHSICTKFKLLYMLNAMASAAVSTFAYHKIRRGRSRYNRAMFYTIVYCENFAMLVIWCWWTGLSDRGNELMLGVIIFTSLCTIASLVAQLCYYHYYHTNSKSTVLHKVRPRLELLYDDIYIYMLEQLTKFSYFDWLNTI